MAWWLIAGAVTGLLVCVPLSLLFDDGGQIVVYVVAGLCGLVFAGGVAVLADRGWWMLAPALTVGVFAPLGILMETHEFVLARFGSVENCTVTSAVESEGTTPRREYHLIDYVAACPSGPMEFTLGYEFRLRTQDMAVYQLPPLRPLLLRDARYEPELLWGPAVAMAVIVLLAAAVRPQPSRT